MSHFLTASSPKVVVGLDFGTTYSGFAFAHCSDPEDVQLFIDWPNASRPYCKTQTALFYASSGKSFKLVDWGWTALVKYTSALQSFRSRRAQSNFSPPSREQLVREVGILVTGFKLYLNGTGLNDGLPPCLTPEKVIVDYLRCISNFIISHLKEKYGKTLSSRDVQWCLTVPAIWTEKSKLKMQVYAEKAGLVQGKHCSNVEASGFPLKIILEPEAASFSCQKQLKEHLQLRKGDKFIVVDIGGGTIDIVVHERAEGEKHSVHEVCASYGEVGGGTFVDRNFFQYLKETIGCFETFKDEEPGNVYRILSWWLGSQGKCTFSGSGSKLIELPRKLSKAWKKHDWEAGHVKHGEFYDEVEISEENLKGMFDTEVCKVVELVNKELKAGVKYIFLVGGFAENAYLLKRVKDKFQGFVNEVICPPNSGAAICKGAVAIGFETGVVLSRISKKTYGIECAGVLKKKDPPSYRMIDGHGCARCLHVFEVFVEKNDSVPVDHVVSYSFYPIERGQEVLTVTLFCSESDRVPRHTTDPSCEKLESYKLDINEDPHLDLEREVLVSMYFGRATIEVSAQRVNFGSNRKPEKLYSVLLDSTTTLC